MISRRFLAVLAVAGLLAGCQQTKSSTPASVPTVDPASTGYLVGSIGRMREEDRRARYRYTLNVCGADGKAIQPIRYSQNVRPNSSAGSEIVTSDFAGDTFVAALPAGRYLLCRADFDIWRDSRIGIDVVDTFLETDDVDVQGSARMALPVTVEAGKTTYIGRYQGVLRAPKLFKARGFYFLVQDAQAADTPILQAKHPQAMALPQIIAVPPTDGQQP